MMKVRMRYAFVALVLVLTVCSPANAMIFGIKPGKPEIDPGLMISALTLLGGSLAVLRVRRKR